MRRTISVVVTAPRTYEVVTVDVAGCWARETCPHAHTCDEERLSALGGGWMALWNVSSASGLVG